MKIVVQLYADDVCSYFCNRFVVFIYFVFVIWGIWELCCDYYYMKTTTVVVLVVFHSSSRTKFSVLRQIFPLRIPRGSQVHTVHTVFSAAPRPAALLHHPPPPYLPPPTCRWSHLHKSLALHVRTPAHGAYVFSPNKLASTRSERVTPPPPRTKIKPLRREVVAAADPPAPSLSAGVIELIVTCARSAPSQSPVSQMHAGRSSPHLLWQLPRGGGGGGLQERRWRWRAAEQNERKNSWRGPAAPVATRWGELPAPVSLCLRTPVLSFCGFYRFSPPWKPPRSRFALWYFSPPRLVRRILPRPHLRDTAAHVWWCEITWHSLRPHILHSRFPLERQEDGTEWNISSDSTPFKMEEVNTLMQMTW